MLFVSLFIGYVKVSLCLSCLISFSSFSSFNLILMLLSFVYILIPKGLLSKRKNKPLMQVLLRFHNIMDY